MIRDISHIEFELRACKVKMRAMLPLMKSKKTNSQWAFDQFRETISERERLIYELQITKEINDSFILNPNYNG